VRRLRQSYPQATLVGLDKGYFAHCLTNADILPECRADVQHFADVRRFPLELLRGVVERAGSRSVYASGGMRDIGDLEATAEAGAGGALIATALHRGAVTQNEIAAFLQRRRSRSDQTRNPAS
jgi:hypothetical protein